MAFGRRGKVPADKAPDEILLFGCGQIFGGRLAINPGEEETEQERGRIVRDGLKVVLSDLGMIG